MADLSPSATDTRLSAVKKLVDRNQLLEAENKKLRQQLVDEDSLSTYQSRVDDCLNASTQSVSSPTATAFRREKLFLSRVLVFLKQLGLPASEIQLLAADAVAKPAANTGVNCGDVMITLAALCQSHKQDLHDDAEMALAKIWKKLSIDHERGLMVKNSAAKPAPESEPRPDSIGPKDSGRRTEPPEGPPKGGILNAVESPMRSGY